MFIYEQVSEILHWKKNTENCAIIHPFRVISNLGWYWNKLKNANEVNVCNNESIWSIIGTFLDIIDCEINEINYKATFTTLFLYRG